VPPPEGGHLDKEVLQRPERASRWSTVAPFLLGLLAFAGLVAVPWEAHRRTAMVQESLLDTYAPARNLVTHIQYELATELAGARGFLITGQQRYVDEHRTAREAREADIAALLAITEGLAPDIYQMVEGLEDRLRAADAPLDELVAGRLSRETYLARLPEQQAIFQGALESAAAIGARLSEATTARRLEIQRITRQAAWVETGLVLLAAVASVATALLGRRLRTLARRLERYGTQQSALREAARALAAVESVKDAVTIIARRAAEDTGSIGAFVERAIGPADGGMVEVVAAEGRGAPLVGTRVPYPGSLSEEIIETGEPHILSEMGALGDSLAPYLRETCRGCTGMVVPLSSEGRILGALVMLREGGGPHYASDEVAVARALGDTASAALRRVLLIEQLEESETRFHLVTDHLRQVIWLGTPDLNERYFVNPACEATFGIGEEEFLHDARVVLDMVHPDDRDRIETAVRAIPDRPYDERYRIVRRDGRVRWIWSRIYPIWDEAGEASLVAGIMEDVTEAQESQAERERLMVRERAALAQSEEARTEAVAGREELEQVTRSRTRLIRGFSHDLKNPLGAADGFLQLLERQVRDPLTPRQRERVAKARRSLHTALGMIENLLSLARAQRGGLELEIQAFDLREVAGEIAEGFRAQAAAAGLELRIETPADRVEIRSDPGKVGQVLGNLLSNAVKYTDRGLITVRVGRAGGAAAVHVIDTGRGIAPEEQGLVFEEFRRAESASGASGSGIGLAISRALARALGGEITLESELGVGSTFTLWLPEEVPPTHLEVQDAHP